MGSITEDSTPFVTPSMNVLDVPYSKHEIKSLFPSAQRQRYLHAAVGKTSYGQELEYQRVVSELIGAEVINVHGGGVFGDKVSTMTSRIDDDDELDQ